MGLRQCLQQPGRHILMCCRLAIPRSSCSMGAVRLSSFPISAPAGPRSLALTSSPKRATRSETDPEALFRAPVPLCNNAHPSRQCVRTVTAPIRTARIATTGKHASRVGRGVGRRQPQAARLGDRHGLLPAGSRQVGNIVARWLHEERQRHLSSHRCACLRLAKSAGGVQCRRVAGLHRFSETGRLYLGQKRFAGLHRRTSAGDGPFSREPAPACPTLRPSGMHPREPAPLFARNEQAHRTPE